MTLLQPSSSQDCDSDGEATKSTKRRISFTPDVSKGKDNTALSSARLSACPALANVFSVMTNSAGNNKENTYSTWNMARCDSTDCCWLVFCRGKQGSGERRGSREGVQPVPKEIFRSPASPVAHCCSRRLKPRCQRQLGENVVFWG